MLGQIHIRQANSTPEVKLTLASNAIVNNYLLSINSTFVAAGLLRSDPSLASSGTGNGYTRFKYRTQTLRICRHVPARITINGFLAVQKEESVAVQPLDTGTALCLNPTLLAYCKVLLRHRRAHYRLPNIPAHVNTTVGMQHAETNQRDYDMQIFVPGRIEWY